MAADEGAFGAYYPQGYNPDIADLEFRGRGGTPTAGVIPSGAAGVLPQVSRQADATLTDIDKLMADAKANGARQSPIGWVLGELMAKLAPSVTGSAARIAQAPIDYVQGRDVDLRASDGLLALPAAGPLAKKIAGGIPGLAVAPETAATVGTGLGAYAIGHGVAGEANAAGEGGNVAMPARMDKAQFLSEHAKFEPKPSAPPDIAVALTEAEGRAKQDPKYDQMGPKGRAAMVETYRTRAESAHAKQLLNLGQQQATWATGADKAFGDAVKGWDAQEAKFNDQGFFDRNPELRGPVMGAGYALPAVLGAGTAIAKNNQGNRFVDQALANAGKDQCRCPR